MRDTLSWIRCSLCGRRMEYKRCNIKGETLVLCPYCHAALSMPGGPCHSGKRRVRQARRLDLDESLLNKLGG